jgi:uncharacterized protein YndB with AHSA1/START domain
MARTTVVRTIHAPIELVFDTVSDISNFSRAIPHILNVEFLTDTRSGVGTRFRETRLMRGREAVTELEVTELVPNERVRLVAYTGGVLWDSVFTVTPKNGSTVLTLTMNSLTNNIMRKLMVLLIGGMLKTALEGDMDAVQAYCEKTKSV